MRHLTKQQSKADAFTIIIGGGLGGLAAGAKLARSHKKVLLIEQNDRIGGCARVIERKDFTHEFSLHQMCGLEEGNLLREILEEFALFDKLEFVKPPNFYRSAIGKIHLTLPHNIGHASETILEKFPSEGKAIRKFFGTLKILNKEGNRWIRRGCDSKFLYPLYPLLYPTMVRYAKTTVGEFLDAITANDDLKLILAALVPWYHDDPYATSLNAFAYGQGSYFIGGGYYIKGGSQRLSNELASIITDKGGVIMLNHLVTRITVKDGRVRGVVYKDLQESGEETKEVFGDSVIANASIPQVAHDLLNPPLNQKLIRKIRRQRPSISFFCVYLKFRRSLSELGNQFYCTIIGDARWSKFEQFAEACQIDDFNLKGMGFTDYSLIDTGMPEESRYSGVLVVVDSLSRWEGLSDAEYEERKKGAASILINRLEKIMPGVKGEIEGYHVVTPRTIYIQTKNPAGTPYGFAQIPSQLGFHRMANASPVKGLYFASAWSRPGAAYMGVICGGYNCAKQVLRGTR